MLTLPSHLIDGVFSNQPLRPADSGGAIPASSAATEVEEAETEEDDDA